MAETESMDDGRRRYKSERDYLLYDVGRGFVGDGYEAVSYGDATRFSAVEANRAVAAFFNVHGRLPVKMKVCPFRGMSAPAA